MPRTTPEFVHREPSRGYIKSSRNLGRVVSGQFKRTAYVKDALVLYCKKHGGQTKTGREIREFVEEHCDPSVDFDNIFRQMARLGFEQQRPRDPNAIAPWVYLVPTEPGKVKTHIRLGEGKIPKQLLLGRRKAK